MRSDCAVHDVVRGEREAIDTQQYLSWLERCDGCIASCDERGLMRVLHVDDEIHGLRHCSSEVVRARLARARYAVQRRGADDADVRRLVTSPRVG